MEYKKNICYFLWWNKIELELIVIERMSRSCRRYTFGTVVIFIQNEITVKTTDIYINFFIILQKKLLLKSNQIKSQLHNKHKNYIKEKITFENLIFLQVTLKKRNYSLNYKTLGLTLILHCTQ